MNRRTSRWLLFAWVALAGWPRLANADFVASVEQGYYVVLWTFPDPPQDPGNYPEGAGSVSINESSYSQGYGPTPFDVTYSGFGPYASAGPTNG